MNAGPFRTMISMLAVTVALAPAVLHAQDVQPQPPAPPAAQSAPAQDFSQQQLDQMLAPIALYPDQLLAQILMASTYPLDVVAADRWVSDPHNAALKGDQLTAALEQQSWDPSVKALAPFPQVLHMMDQRLDWMEQVGDAFVGQPNDVTSSVQRLRAQANAAGKLKSNSYIHVTTVDRAIEIAPATADQVYVPYYNPADVYGTWAYADYPPDYFPPPADYVDDGYGLYFGAAFPIVPVFWGWSTWDWDHHDIRVDEGRYNRIAGNEGPHINGDVWHHDPAHRGGVPYRDAAAPTRYQTAVSGAVQRGGFGGRAAAAGAVQPTGRPNIAQFERGLHGNGTRVGVSAANRFAARPEAARPGVAHSGNFRPAVTRPGTAQSVRPQAFSHNGRPSFSPVTHATPHFAPNVTHAPAVAHQPAFARPAAPHMAAPRAAAPHFAAPRAAAPVRSAPAPHVAAPAVAHAAPRAAPAAHPAPGGPNHP